jgi:hypothetical protein
MAHKNPLPAIIYLWMPHHATISHKILLLPLFITIFLKNPLPVHPFPTNPLHAIRLTFLLTNNHLISFKTRESLLISFIPVHPPNKMYLLPNPTMIYESPLTVHHLLSLPPPILTRPTLPHILPVASNHTTCATHSTSLVPPLSHVLSSSL